MTLLAFQRSLQFTYKMEGGYQDVEEDVGNWYRGKLIGTNRGISAPTLAEWLGASDIHLMTPTYMKSLSTEVSDAIYLSAFWNSVKGGYLPNGVDLMVFDFAVNAGIFASAGILQECLAFPTPVDRAIGPVTEAAANACDPAALIVMLGMAHEMYYQSLQQFPQFGEGWLARTQACQVLANDIALRAKNP